MTRGVFHILIADRNQNVLEFLRREFLREGYRVQVAKDGFDLCNSLRSDDRPDLVILDPDLPFMDDCGTRELLNRLSSEMPIVLHPLGGEKTESSPAVRTSLMVPKTGDPAALKRTVRRVLEMRRETGDRP
ncbi:MAG: response regulator [Thermodesulfobacteriota bacterium]